MRKIVQISTVYDPPNVKIFALCDDGTIWWSRIVHTGLNEWVEGCQPIPQPKTEITIKED